MAESLMIAARRTAVRLHAQPFAVKVDCCADELNAALEAARLLPSYEQLTAQRDAMRAALQGLFDNCAMVHKHWGEGSNAREADAAIATARAQIALEDGPAPESVMVPLLVRIPDADDLRYDKFALAPPGMSEHDAITAADNLIREVQAADPNEYTWEDFEPRLEALGFVFPCTARTTESW